VSAVAPRGPSMGGENVGPSIEVNGGRRNRLPLFGSVRGEVESGQEP